MIKTSRHVSFLIFILSIFVCKQSYAQALSANAGSDKIVCPGLTATLGGFPAATGGKAPYTYSWSPTNFLSSSTTANPICTPLSYVTYTLTVTDDTGAVATDIVVAQLYYIDNINAGNDTSICENSFALLGGDLNVTGAGVTYSWLPTTYLDNNTLPRPTSTPLVSTTYTLTASFSGCPPKTDAVTVTIIPTPVIDAGPDVTIQQGQLATLTATGGFFYSWWAPVGGTTTITYPYTANPDVEPTITTVYYLYGADNSNKCPNYDSVTVTVTKNDEMVFYNTFTPNGDGINDTWYIGNVYKHPNNKLEIYNRNGKLVYKKNGYDNSWDGKAFGQELPRGTYFYTMDLGDGEGTKHGTVTIID